MTRVRFDLDEGEPFTFVLDGVSYPFNQLEALAEKHRSATLVSEYVYKLPNIGHVFVTVVGDDDQYGNNGLYRGWYVVERVSDKDAAWLIETLKPFTDLYK